jgi:hypothetical protein
MRNEHPNPMITYPALEYARDYFNLRLFRGELRTCLITVRRRRTACGFFAPGKFRSHDRSDIADEIGLDPQYWGPPHTDAENLSVLVHEMVHLWQHHHGRRRSRGGYHNREFARKMFEVGLITSDTGARGGKPTGTRMSHYILPDGPFERACVELLNGGYVIPYVEINARSEEEERRSNRRHRSRAASKTAYVCPNHHDVRAWGKPRLPLKCGLCEVTLENIGFASREEEWSAWPDDLQQDAAGTRRETAVGGLKTNS